MSDRGKPIEETESREREMRGLVLEKSEKLCRWEKEKRSRRRRKDNRHRKGGGCELERRRGRAVVPSIAPSAQLQCHEERGEPSCW